ncbi:2-oxo-4-hydroxy-4-carboxy-5-ureidoimidazoline decarboxylase [Ralstonia sp. 151470066-2]|jgi:2-oxo-4-hydroxy-4-carboxy-5-ureidoimidazoline decarboxylase
MQWTIKRGVTTFAVASAFAVLSASAIGQSPESKPAAQPTQPASAKLVHAMNSIAQLNAMDKTQFVQVLGGVYEHSPWVAERVATQRPFASVEALRAAMRQTVSNAGEAQQIKLVRSHPELAGRAAVRGEMTAASTREQGGAGLAQLTPEEFARLQDLNKRYSEKFGFPFVMAVRGYDRQAIIDALATRLNNDRDTELRTSLEQIDRIAGFRLNDLISG